MEHLIILVVWASVELVVSPILLLSTDIWVQMVGWLLWWGVVLWALVKAWKIFKRHYREMKGGM